jgi:hypothetical protein
MKTYGGVGPPFLISELDGRELLDSRPGNIIPEERAPCTHWIGVWVGYRAGLAL